MRTNDPLRLPLSTAAVYVILAGVILLFPALSGAVFGRPTLDPALEGLYGVALINIGGLYAVLARQRVRSSGMIAVQLAGLLLAAAIMVAYWSTGDFTARTILVPLLLNLLLAAWIGSQLARARLPGTQATGA